MPLSELDLESIYYFCGYVQNVSRNIYIDRIFHFWYMLQLFKILKIIFENYFDIQITETSNKINYKKY